MDIYLHTWSTCLFIFKVLGTKIPKGFCSVTSKNFESFIELEVEIEIINISCLFVCYLAPYLNIVKMTL